MELREVQLDYLASIDMAARSESTELSEAKCPDYPLHIRYEDWETQEGK